MSSGTLNSTHSITYRLSTFLSTLQPAWYHPTGQLSDNRTMLTSDRSMVWM